MDLPEKKQRWVFHADALPQPAGAGVTRRVLAYTDGLMCVENTFEKGAVGALHHHPHTQITYVVSGAFAFTVDGVTRTVHAGDTILKEDGVEHGCVCTEAGILLDIFAPMREDFVKRFGAFCNRSSKKAVRRVGRTAFAWCDFILSITRTELPFRWGSKSVSRYRLNLSTVVPPEKVV